MKLKTFLIPSFLLLSFYFSLLSLSAQTPAWVDYEQRQQLYPLEEYFIGFASDKQDKQGSENELLGNIKMSAKEELVNTVQITVESISSQYMSEVNDQFSKSFKTASTSFSKMDLSGLQTQTYFDKRKKTGYALAWVKKEDLIDYYLEQLEQHKLSIAAKISAAEHYISNDNKKDALKAYYECMPLFREAESAYAIVILLRASKDQITQINEYEVRVKQGIESLHLSEQLNLSELCSILSYSLQIQTGDFNESIRLGSFTFEDTRMSSPFSRRFINAFQKELIEEGNYNINMSEPKPGDFESDYLLKGTYWQDGQDIKVIAILRNVKTGKAIASSEGHLPLEWLNQRDISYKPENFGQAAESLQLFKSNEITNGGMQLDLYTNKGFDNPIFEEDEQMQLYIRVNHECYIRIVDHMADGSKVLLVDNLFIGSDKVNMTVPILDLFQCAAPFGVEFLQANAQTKPFPALHTTQQYGYAFIQDDLSKLLSNTRGFIKVSNEDLKAEKRVVVTTMKKMEKD